jgi:hypothetical protein
MHFTAAPVALNLAQKFEALAARSPSFRPSDPDLPRRFGRSTRSAFKLAQGEDQLAFVRSWRCHAPAKGQGRSIRAASEHGGTEAALEASQACVGPEVRRLTDKDRCSVHNADDKSAHTRKQHCVYEDSDHLNPL